MADVRALNPGGPGTASAAGWSAGVPRSFRSGFLHVERVGNSPSPRFLAGSCSAEEAVLRWLRPEPATQRPAKWASRLGGNGGSEWAWL